MNIQLTPEQINGLKKHEEDQIERCKRVYEKWKQKQIAKKTKKKS
jgi:hypothetical protein